jgi:hypothetical protein
MKLRSPEKPHIWHVYVYASACWIRAYPKDDSDRIALELYKKLGKFVKYNIKYPTQEKPFFEADFWFEELDSDVVIFKLFEFCHKRYNSIEYKAELKLEEPTHSDWEFQLAWYEVERDTDYSWFYLTNLSIDEMDKFMQYIPEEAWFAASTALLASRRFKNQPGGMQMFLRHHIEGWEDEIQKRQ